MYQIYVRQRPANPAHHIKPDLTSLQRNLFIREDKDPNFHFSLRPLPSCVTVSLGIKQRFDIINTTAQCTFDIRRKIKLTFSIKEAGLLAVVNHFLLALLWPWYDGTELFSWGAVVELHDVRFLKRGALDRNWSWAVVRQHRPHLLLYKEKVNLSACANTFSKYMT